MVAVNLGSVGAGGVITMMHCRTRLSLLASCLSFYDEDKVTETAYCRHDTQSDGVELEWRDLLLR